MFANMDAKSRRGLLLEALREAQEPLKRIPGLVPLVPAKDLTGEDCYQVIVDGYNYLVMFWNAYNPQVGIRVPTSISGVPSDYLIEIDVTPDTPNIVEIIRKNTAFHIDISEIKRQCETQYKEEA